MVSESRDRFAPSHTEELHMVNARIAMTELCRKDPKNTRRRKNVRTNNAKICNSEE